MQLPFCHLTDVGATLAVARGRMISAPTKFGVLLCTGGKTASLLKYKVVYALYFNESTSEALSEGQHSK
jgi:hypothetical protein